jgi:hypothetical protein
VAGRQRNRDLAAVSPYREREGVKWRRFADMVGEVSQRRHPPPINPDDDVTGSKPRAGSRAARLDAADLDAAAKATPRGQLTGEGSGLDPNARSAR